MRPHIAVMGSSSVSLQDERSHMHTASASAWCIAHRWWPPRGHYQHAREFVLQTHHLIALLLSSP